MKNKALLITAGKIVGLMLLGAFVFGTWVRNRWPAHRKLQNVTDGVRL